MEVVESAAADLERDTQVTKRLNSKSKPKKFLGMSLDTLSDEEVKEERDSSREENLAASLLRFNN